MKGKGLIRFFNIALILVCLYQLMFTGATWWIERKAASYAKEKVYKDGVEPTPAPNATEEQKAAFIDSVNRRLSATKRRYLDSVSNEKVVNLLIADFTYQQVKERELSLGLDLQGGMSVVLQVSEDEIVKAMSNYSKDTTFNRALTLANQRLKTEPGKDFVTLFGEAFQQTDPGAKLAAIFATPENQ